MMILCRECGQECKKAKSQSGNICVDCYKEYQVAYQAANKSRIATQRRKKYLRQKQDAEWLKAKRTRSRNLWRKYRHDAMMAYGGYVCACCGEAEPRFLTLDHIMNNGSEHRKAIGVRSRGAGIFKWLNKHGYPAGFQVLCMNCNHGKALNNGICPHKNTEAPEALAGLARP
jgi:hypothetical protein